MAGALSQLSADQLKLWIDLVDLGKVTIPAAITLLAAILSARLGYQYAERRFRAEKHLDFVRRQITEIYSPLVGLNERIRTSGELRVELSHGAERAWKRICKEQPHPFEDHDKFFEPFERQIEKENERFPQFLLPLYQEMVTVFTKNFWLAEDSTKEFYQPFCRFVELWERYLDEAIPSRVLEEVPIEEDSLVPFYEDLESTLARLRAELSNG